MRTSLKNPYYFVKDSVIFNISTTNSDEDPCGKHYKTFDTETKNLKKGTYYFDKNGNRKLTTQDGNVEVSLNTAYKAATITANKSVFPYFDVTYKYNDNSTETVTYWLDDLIEDGDKLTSNKFKNKTIHTETGDTTISYVEFYKKQCLKKLADEITEGITLENLQSNNPFLFVGAKTKLNGSDVTVTSSGIVASDEEISNILIEKIKTYGDKLLEVFGKNCNVTING